MTQEEKINELERKVEYLEERDSKLTRALVDTMYMMREVAHMANNTHYDYSGEEREIVAALKRLSASL